LVIKKLKGKESFTIIAPKIFNEREIGVTITSEPKNLIGRRVTFGLMELTNDISKYYMKFTFRIYKVDGNRALTKFDGSECLRDYISRMILRRVRRIDSIQDNTTKDGIKLRVKGLAITSRKIKSSVEKVVRKKIKEIIKNEVEGYTLDEFIKKVISDELKNKILTEIRKIYPARNFEFRKIEVLS
jgi:small subunit ribosomal protein S3Ae